MPFRPLSPLTARAIAFGTFIVGLTLLAAKDGEAATKEGDKQTAVARIRKDQLRYAGKSFEQWREQLLTELMPKVRIESIKVLIVFAHHGYGAETTAALLEVGRDYETIMELAKSNYEGAFEPKLFRSDGDEPDEEAVYEASALAAGKIGPAAVLVLRKGLKDENWSVRAFALYALEKMGGNANEAVPDVIELFEGQDLHLRRFALVTLGNIGAKDKRVLAPLRTALKDKDKGIRCAALDALVELGPNIAGSAREDILEALKDRVPKVRQKSIVALEKSGLSAKVVPPLLKATHDTDAEVQHEAYRCLQQLGSQAKEAVPALIAILKRPPANEDKKQDRRIRGPRMDIPVPGVVAYRSDRFDEFSHVVETLGAIGPEAKEAVPVLKKLLEKINQPHQREKINEALKRIAGENTPSPSAQAIDAPSPF